MIFESTKNEEMERGKGTRAQQPKNVVRSRCLTELSSKMSEQIC
jgi:hypothetical protein